MSGAAGGNRIQKKDVNATFQAYIKTVLEKVPGFKEANLSGSVKLGTKPDYGDLDLIVWFEGDDKREVKQRLIQVLQSLPSSIIVPFKSEKYVGKRYHNAGELISVLFPIQGADNEFIQVDNIIALTKEEQDFKTGFLDLPAEKQGLLIGLAKVILLEKSPERIFQKLGIRNLPPLEANQEYEFNLSSVKLSLRKVTLDNYRELAREEVWSTTNWNTISDLFEGFRINGTFEELLEDLVKTLKNPRSKDRIKGIFKSMVSVKSGEVGTPKAFGKEKALAAVDNLLEENKSGEVVALYGGGFKPPHKGHFANAKALAKEADRLIVFIGPKVREGLQITAQQSKKIWELYSRYLPIPVEIYISEVTPIRDTYEWAEANQENVSKIITGTTKEEMSRFSAFHKNKEKYPNVVVKELPVVITDEEAKLSATTIRQSEDYLQSGEWLPDEIQPADIKKIVQILLPVFEQKTMSGITDFLNNFYQATEALLEQEEAIEIDQTIPEVPAIHPKGEGLTLEKLKQRISDQIGDTYYNIDIENGSIVITPKSTERSSEVFDYMPYITSILEYAIEKRKIKKSLPEVKLVQDREQAEEFFGRTAYYDPNAKEIVLYTLKRHPKDVMRSFCHELIHHLQNEENRLHTISTTNTNEDNQLVDLEKEAYLEGNMLFRTWEDKIKNEESTRVI
jgi:nicotinamide mononucleotide adenylyltransferase